MVGRKRSFSPIRTKYPGVYYIVGTDPKGDPCRILYVSYRRDGKQHFDKIGVEGHLRDGRKLTPAIASDVRMDKISGKELPNRERRELERAEKAAEASRWTFDKLWAEWKKVNAHKSGAVNDDSRYKAHLQPLFGDKEPREVLPLEVDRLRLAMLKGKGRPPGRKFDPNAKRRADYSEETKRKLAEVAANRERKPYAIGTVVSVLSLFRRIASFAVNRGLCPGLNFKVEIPKGAKQKTEDMTERQMAQYIRVCREWPDPQAGNFQLLELYTGMRRGEVRKLKWTEVDFERGFILLRDPKGGEDQRIPMSDAAQELLEGHPEDKKNPYVFSGEMGGPRGIRQIAESSRKIRDAAGLPKDFRPNHALRHVFGSHLASSGEVDLYTLQRLMTHKSPIMMQRYAHLRDESLKRGANVMSRIVKEAEGRAK
jgi:integrase